MSPLPFVDAHVHLWDLAGPIRYSWLSPPFTDEGPNGSTEAIARNYLPEDYRADSARWNVKGTVHVDAGADGDQALDETRWLENLAEDSRMPDAIVAFAALDDAKVERLLEAYSHHGRVRGVRQIVNWHASVGLTYTKSDLTLSGRWRDGYALLGRYGLSFDLQCYPGQMAALAAFLADHPETPVVVNHMGMPVVSDPDGVAQWRAGMRTLSRLPHVSTKISGLGFIHRNWTSTQIRPFILDVIDVFGTDRCMFGSDTPTDKLFAPFDRIMEAYHEAVTAFSDGEKKALFAENANHFYRLGLDV